MATDQNSISKAVGVSRRDLKRLARAAARVERSRGGGSRPIYDRGRYGASASFVLTGVVSTTITARSGTTLGSGQVTLCITDGDAGTETVSGDSDDIIPVKNSFAVAFAADSTKRVKIHWEGNCYKVLTREC